VPLFRQCGKTGAARQATDENIIQRMPFACRKIRERIEICDQNILYLLLFHGKSGYANGPQCYFIRTLSILFSDKN